MPYKSEREHEEHERLMQILVSLIMLGGIGFVLIWGFVVAFSILVLVGLVV